MGVVIRRWVWLEYIGVVSGCFPHITYISLLHLYLFFFAAASLLLFSFCYIYIYQRNAPANSSKRGSLRLAPIIIIIITSAMQSINGASLKEHWATQHCLHGSNSTTT